MGHVGGLTADIRLSKFSNVEVDYGVSVAVEKGDDHLAVDLRHRHAFFPLSQAKGHLPGPVPGLLHGTIVKGGEKLYQQGGGKLYH